MTCGCRCNSDPMLLLLWCRPAAIAPTGPLAWEPSYPVSAALKKQKDQEEEETNLLCSSHVPGVGLSSQHPQPQHTHTHTHTVPERHRGHKAQPLWDQSAAIHSWGTRRPFLPAYLELFKLPSSEAALEGPLFFDNHDLTPSTRSSSSESTSESPSLWDEEQKGRQGWEEGLTRSPGGIAEVAAGVSWAGVGCRGHAHQ